MKKNFFSQLTILLTALVIMLSCVSASALEKNLNVDNNILTVTGIMADCSYGDVVGVFVLYPGKNPEDIALITGKDDLNSVIIGGDYSFTDENGRYIADINMQGGDEGVYTIVAMTREGKIDKDEVYFADKSVRERFAAEISELIKKDKSTSADLMEKLALDDENSYFTRIFAINKDNLILKVSPKMLADILYIQLTANEKYNVIDADNFMSAVNKSADIAAIDEGVINIVDCSDKFDLDALYLNFCNKMLSTFSENEKKPFYSSVKELFVREKPLTEGSVKALFSEGIINGFIKCARGWEDYKSIIEDLGGNIGINMTDYAAVNKDKIPNYLGSYTNKNDFVSDVNAALTTLKNASGSTVNPSKPGGGGGGGGYAPINSKVTEPQPETVPLDQMAEQPSFSDVPDGYWAKQYIDSLMKKGILNGTGNGIFEPEKSVTREEFVKMVVLGLGLELTNDEVRYEDLSRELWSYPYVAAATTHGIINGISETEFGAGSLISRQDAAVIMFRALKKESSKNDLFTFSDDNLIADYAKNAVYTLRNFGIINGVSETEFAPEDACTRAQAAKLIYQLTEVQ